MAASLEDAHLALISLRVQPERHSLQYSVQGDQGHHTSFPADSLQAELEIASTKNY